MKIKLLSTSLVATLFLTVIGTPSFANQESINHRVTLESLSEEAIDDHVNTIVLDEEGKIVNEFHSDGFTVNYQYEDGKLVSSTDNDGGKEEYSVKNGKFEVKSYKNGKLHHKNTKYVNDSGFSIEFENEDGVSTEDKLNEKNTDQEIQALATNEDYYVEGVRMNDFFSNSQLTNTSGFDASAIQTWLTGKKSILADFVQVYRYNSNGDVYDAGIKVLPATLLHNAQRDYGISAKVLLAMLQKESSLVKNNKEKIPFSDRRFIYAFGNGATDGGDILSLSGFDKQIPGAAATLKKYFDEGKKKTYPYKMTINKGIAKTANGVTYKGEIWVRNAATYTMFKYTPWSIDTKFLPNTISGGNYLFHEVYTGFFN